MVAIRDISVRSVLSIIAAQALILGLSLPARAAPMSDYMALIIGNSAYRFTSPLKNPVNDATALASALERLGFKVSRGLDLSSSAMNSQISLFAESAGEAKVIFFYYAGHGMQIDGQNYLVPVDFDPVGNRTLGAGLVGIDKVLNNLTGEQSVSIVILDACRDNPLVSKLSAEIKSGRNMSISGDRGIKIIGKGLAEIKGRVGTLIAYATQPGNVAADGDRNHSPFADGLLQYIESPGLEIRDILTQVRKHVIKETRNSQIPWDHSSLVERVYLKHKLERPAPPP
jgi:uncharacterized caspase-like protein